MKCAKCNDGLEHGNQSTCPRCGNDLVPEPARSERGEFDVQRLVGLRWLIEEWPGQVLGHYGEMIHYTNESSPRLQWFDGERWHDVPTVRERAQPNA